MEEIGFSLSAVSWKEECSFSPSFFCGGVFPPARIGKGDLPLPMNQGGRIGFPFSFPLLFFFFPNTDGGRSQSCCPPNSFFSKKETVFLSFFCWSARVNRGGWFFPGASKRLLPLFTTFLEGRQGFFFLDFFFFLLFFPLFPQHTRRFHFIFSH